jgi:hypothetical protein
MECFIDLVGIKGCGEIPDGGWINTLPGISLEVIDSMADSEQITYKEVWADVQKEASVQFKHDLIAKINECYDINTECDYENIICAEENVSILTVAWRFKLGNQLMIERLYSSRINWVTLAKEQASELKDFYQVEYEKALSQAVKFMDLSECCLKCGGGNPKYETWLP